jgi:hypothetical protein
VGRPRFACTGYTVCRIIRCLWWTDDARMCHMARQALRGRRSRDQDVIRERAVAFIEPLVYAITEGFFDDYTKIEVDLREGRGVLLCLQP